jgi:glyoxylase-like metal-dependent hydrolase (beta-lactamase superfamily II)
MTCTADVISIGTLSRNVFWGESAAVRSAHATTTLIRDGGTVILVDPSLPAELLAHRLHERAGIKPEQIDAVFLTTFLPVHRRGLCGFDSADWLMHEVERAAMIKHLNRALEEVSSQRQSDPVEIEQELALLGRIKPAPDKLSPTVHLFPSPGPSPGTAGLLIAGTRTIVLAGDAVLSRDHYENARIHDRCADAAQARQSFAEIVEIADVIIPGHDNVIVAI